MILDVLACALFVGAAPAVLSGSNVDQLSVAAIKDLLTQLGKSDDVWALTQRQPAAKRADWVALARSAGVT